ncbi:hypothetical protein AXG93_3506s1000 [Marchantia polymorpha subsp. ruderalis]|uniref:Integrator complex subunit 4/Protein SIEL C-terminal Ig-like domain-containing protein n=1 Tax=Marchantia polymorpha subsp. ruderalis TaxID=1480154 RepID=A0A176VNP0_MARPO|nr:hypothetical protein AXG93_3506s1000 [Marchantia polymorpha subsp. ruderalis]
MKRVREIDLEAPVMEDDEGEEDGDSYMSAWDGRSPTKRTRWMHPHESGTTQGQAQSGVWPRDLRIAIDINGEAQENSGTQQRHVDGGDTLFSRSRPFAGIDLQLAIPSDSFELKQPGEVSLQQIQDHNHVEHLEAVVRGNGVENIRGFGKTVKQRPEDVQIKSVKAKSLTYYLSAADMLYLHIDRQDNKLHSLLEKEGALLHDTEVDVRLRATQNISGRLGLVKESATRNLLIDLFQQQLWKEADLSVSLALVKLLSTAAVVKCVDDVQRDNVKSVEIAASHSVALYLLQYIKAKDVQSCPMKSSMKLQVLRAIHNIGNLEDLTVIDTLQDLAADQLGSPNPKCRELGIRLLVASVRDRRGNSHMRKGDLETYKRRAFSGYNLKSWKEGQSLMRSLLEYTRDPHPSVREVVVWALLQLHSKGFSLDNDTYKHGVALFKDSFEGVRLQAIKLVGLCAKELIDGAQSKLVDNAYMRVCSMMTDMSVPVKVEVCNTLGEMTGVSESLLLQSLSKKVSATTVAEVESNSSVVEGEVDAAALEERNLLSWSAGAFVVALEDEFWEVRSAAVKSLATLANGSAKMAIGALELVADMINDDSYFFLGVLEDSRSEIRKAGHDLLSTITLPSISTFQVTIRAILTSFEKHPEDEESLFTTLEKLGLSHAGYTECIISELLQELRGLLNKEPGLDDPQCMGILVLLLAAASSNVKIISTIPTHILALPRLVSHRLRTSLPSLVGQSIGFKSLRYTWFSKKSSLLTASDSSELRIMDFGKQQFGTSSYHDVSNKERSNAAGPYSGGHADYESSTLIKPILEHKTLFSTDLHRRTCLSQAEVDEILICIRNTLSIALNSRHLLEIRAFEDVLQRLSGCRKELNLIKGRCSSLNGAVTFSSLYLNCLEVVVQLQSSISTQGASVVVARKSGLPHDLLLKLDSGVKYLLYRFRGLSYDQLSQVYELYALVFLWKLVLHPSEALVNDGATSMPLQELASIVRVSKKTSEDETTPPSFFLSVIEEQLLGEEGSAKGTSKWKCAREVALSFWPREISVVASSEVWAHMKVPGPDFDHQIEFVPGLPLGISVDITLHNVSESSALWIQFAVDSSAVQYRYLDMGDSQVSSACNVRQLTIVLQLENMQAGASCVSRICIVLEGLEYQGNYKSCSSCRGPKGSVVPLCSEKEAHLVNLLIKERSSKLAPPIRR